MAYLFCMDRRVFSAFSVAVTLLIVGAVDAVPRPQVFGYSLWEKAVIERGLDPNEVVYPFRANEEMAEWARRKVRSFIASEPEFQLQALQDAFFDAGEFEFSYDQVRTLTAEEAFAARSGNCMSFTSLFVAVSRSIGIPSFLVSVRRQPDVDREDGLVVVNRHVVAGYRSPAKVYLYDFYVTSKVPYIYQRVIDDLTASAIYHTNHGGLAIRSGDLNGAMRHLEIATTLDPEWAPGWVNLGVAEFRQGKVEAAFDAYEAALRAEPGNSSALTNMAHAYSKLGREEEARAALAAAAEGTRNPFTLIAMADAEMIRGDFDEARRYLRKARWWYRKQAEVYDALARLAHHEGDDDKAEKYAARAAELRAEQAEVEAGSAVRQ